MTTRKQCAKCPWKKSTNPHDIPNGYCPDKHAALHNTIAPQATLHRGPLTMMACHESPVGGEQPCCGWLAHQLGPGNNLGLRMIARRRRDLSVFELDGDQRDCLEDTLP